MAGHRRAESTVTVAVLVGGQLNTQPARARDARARHQVAHPGLRRGSFYRVHPRRRLPWLLTVRRVPLGPQGRPPVAVCAVVVRLSHLARIKNERVTQRADLHTHSLGSLHFCLHEAYLRRLYAPNTNALYRDVEGSNDRVGDKSTTVVLWVPLGRWLSAGRRAAELTGLGHVSRSVGGFTHIGCPYVCLVCSAPPGGRAASVGCSPWAGRWGEEELERWLLEVACNPHIDQGRRLRSNAVVDTQPAVIVADPGSHGRCHHV